MSQLSKVASIKGIESMPNMHVSGYILHYLPFCLNRKQPFQVAGYRPFYAKIRHLLQSTMHLSVISLCSQIEGDKGTVIQLSQY